MNGYYVARLREQANFIDPHLDDYLRKQMGGFIETLRLIDPYNLSLARLKVPPGARRGVGAPLRQRRGRDAHAARHRVGAGHGALCDGARASA